MAWSTQSGWVTATSTGYLKCGPEHRGSSPQWLQARQATGQEVGKAEKHKSGDGSGLILYHPGCMSPRWYCHERDGLDLGQWQGAFQCYFW